MKKLILPLFVIVLAFISTTTAKAELYQSELYKMHQAMPTDTLAVYKLFPTMNTWNFIKLNTRNGQMTQVQYGTSGNRMETTLSDIPLCSTSDERNGRFTLYPTANTYNFILLDQINGKCWQVQWSIDYDERGVWRIY